MLTQIRISVLMLAAWTVLTGLAYPLAVTGIAQVVFPGAANGSLIMRDGKPVGSELIGQPFDDPRYFWGRPSATGPVPYNAGASSGSNLAIGNPAQLDAIKARVEKLRAADAAAGVTRDAAERVPIDLVTASGSGLDPHISTAGAAYQAARVAAVRNMPLERVRELIAAATEGRQLGVLGEPRVNVLRLNLALDEVGAQ